MTAARKYVQNSSDSNYCNVQYHDSDEEGVPDTAILQQDLWNSISPIAQDRQSDKIAVSLNRLLTSSNCASSSILSLICWAVCDSANLLDNESIISCPRNWKNHHKDVFEESNRETRGSFSYSLTSVRVIPLSEVILTAFSTEALEFARSQSSRIKSLLALDRRILRLGGTFTCNANPSSQIPLIHEYDIVSLSPTLQGFLEPSLTRLIVTVVSPSHTASLSTNKCEPECDDVLTEHGCAGVDVVVDELLEIDERFLASYTLRPSPTSDNTCKIFDSSKESYPLESGSSEDSLNTEFSHELLPYKLNNLKLTARAVPQGNLSYFGSDSQHDENSMIFVQTADLGKIRAFNGDWVSVAVPGSSNRRIAKLITADHILNHPGEAWISPLLFANVFGDKLFGYGRIIIITPSPLGPHSPSIPVAKIATLARVASPINVNRSFQSDVFQALREHFIQNRRLVKKGDVIAIWLDRNDFIRNYGDLGIDSDVIVKLEYSIFKNTCRKDVTYFVVTNLEYDIPVGMREKELVDFHMECAAGEYGCWIDPNATKLIQAGLEHCSVPDLDSQMIENAVNDRAFQKVTDTLVASLQTLRFSDSAVSVLLRGTEGIGKSTIADEVAKSLAMHLLSVDCFEIIGDTDIQTQGSLKATFEKALSCSPCVLLLENVDAFSRPPLSGKDNVIANALQECISEVAKAGLATGHIVIVIGTTADMDKVSSNSFSYFTQEFMIEALDEKERYKILSSILHPINLAAAVSVRRMALQTAALTPANLLDLLVRADLCATKRVNNILSESTSRFTYIDVLCAGLIFEDVDFDIALNSVRKSYSQSIGAPKIPDVIWDDVGGLSAIKSEILDTIQLPLEHPELFTNGLKRRSGILLYGPPGTGKTLLAKAVATSCSLNFLSIKGPELLNMYIGESEANVRRIFSRARDAEPCVVFFDELDSIAPRRGNHGDSGGVMDRIVSQLLAELDGMSSSKVPSNVFVMGATNRPDLLDPALLRPGRFDRMLYLGVSQTHEAQLDILKALTRHFKLHPDLDLKRIAQACPFNYTGADFYALCSDAMLRAISSKADEIERKIDVLNKSCGLQGHPYPLTAQYYINAFGETVNTDILISQQHFEHALDELIPSVSKDEMDYYQIIQRKFVNDM